MILLKLAKLIKRQKMILSILTNTPLYVYWIFFSLVFVGISQIKTRHIGLKRALIIPIVLVFLSIFGVLFAFGITFLSLSLWAFGLFLGVTLNKILKKEREVTYCFENKIFTIEGSFMPLITFMIIFFTKYTIGVITAMNLDILHTAYFIIIVSLLYGIFTGLYLVRLLVFIRKMKQDI